MFYLFTGNSRLLIHQEALKWKHAFREKYGDENVISISELDQMEGKELVETLVSRSIFSEKRLIIIDGFPYGPEKQSSKALEMEALILENLKYVPAETLVVFLSENPDKRTLSFKEVSKIADIKDFSLEWNEALFQFFSKKYPQIDTDALLELIRMKAGNMQKIQNDLEKLSITLSHIHKNDVETIIIPEFEESIFVFIDTLLLKEKKKVLKEFRNLLEFSNIYALYQSIIANLRVYLYIEYLKNEKKTQRDIADILKLGNRQFLIGKKHTSSYKEIEDMYRSFLEFDKNMKFWNFILSDEDFLQKEIEAVFLKFLGK